MKKLKVLIIVEYFIPHIGGVERVVLEVGKRLAAKGHKVYVVTTEEDHYPPGLSMKLIKSFFFNVVRQYSYEGIMVTRIMIPRFGRRYIFALVLLPLLIALSPDVDIVHSANNYTVALPAFLYARLSGKIATISIWEIWGKRWMTFLHPILGTFFQLYEHLVLSLRFDQFFPPSKFVAQQLTHTQSERITIAPLGGKRLVFNENYRQDLRRQLSPRNTFNFIYYGRLGLSKGVNVLIRAMVPVVKQRKNVRLFLFVPLAQKSERIVIQSVIDSLALTKYVSLNPSIPEGELSAYLSFADCVVVPDLTISFGLVALEASQMGRLLVTTTGGGLPEVAFGKVIFVKPGSIRSLAIGLVKAIRGHWTLVPPKRFSWQKTAHRYTDAFKSLS